ncbi:hypothetical protein GALMADRAFT_137114 [Galerina marginata CBS 339.88]|uniref:RING-type domain-containing protein n=1 Tax=Galerina marginata (strain CBS 339.88) TaxID=685588 RepID=A0A067TJS7_GALM3|nr:hypothetical protein GALMADRAFT_137114 [Galerina marginata CBS 339.88]
MQSYLGAGASCQICFEPFGRLEELKAPYAVACGHIFCVGCLDNNDPCCRICGVPFDRHPYSRLLALNGLAAAKGSTPPGYEQLGPQLQEAMGLVNEYTNVRHLRSLHERATFFLDSQPRNRFRDLDTSVRLLGCLLQAKDASEAQSQLMSVLTERVHRLTNEKSDLQTKLDEMDRRHAYDHAFLVDRIPNLMRKNPDVTVFALLTN